MAKQSYAQQIATTIWQQIRATAPNDGAVMAWGIDARFFGTTEDKEKNPFLELKVFGSKFEGNLRVVYHQCPDVYSIHFYDQQGKEIMDRQKTMVYAMDLFDILDNEIELPWR
jgi:hypothetical protein